MSIGGKREGAGRKPGLPNKATAEVRKIASEHGPEAIQTLVELMSNKDTVAQARISAAKEIIERAYGKSGNIVVLNTDVPISEMSPVEALKTIGNFASTGEITVDEAAKLTSIIEARIKAVELEEIAERLTKLEERRN